MRSKPISTTLPESERLTEGRLNHPAVHLDEFALVKSAFCKWFAAGCARTKAASIAAAADVSEQFVSAVCQGRKPPTLKLLAALFSDPEGFTGFVEAAGKEHGFGAPARKRKISRKQALEASVRATRQMLQIWQIMRPTAAQLAETTEEDLEAALDSHDDEAVSK